MNLLRDYEDGVIRYSLFHIPTGFLLENIRDYYGMLGIDPQFETRLPKLEKNAFYLARLKSWNDRSVCYIQLEAWGEMLFLEEFKKRKNSQLDFFRAEKGQVYQEYLALTDPLYSKQQLLCGKIKEVVYLFDFPPKIGKKLTRVRRKEKITAGVTAVKSVVKGLNPFD